MNFLQIISTIIVFTFNYAIATELQIGIFSGQNIKSVVIIPIYGTFSLTSNDNNVCEVKAQSSIEVIASGNNVIVKCNGKSFGSFSKIFLKAETETSSFKIKCTNPSQNSITYENSLGIKALNGILNFINALNLDHYVTGVIEAEAGSNQNLEYYKLQAIICRTYALGNLRRHEQEGFNLCDKVHCQVYKGISKSNPEIKKATHETTDMVIVDKNLNIIQATFHSNCGGETANAENVWTIPVSCLKSVKDTFCNDQPHANWQKIIKLSEWESYLAKYNISVPVNANKNALCFVQIDREVYYSYNNQKIPLKTIRNDWDLRSTYFDVKQKNDSIIFIGRGFGHGVGLCQEGSMKMTSLGYSFIDILNYYYTDIYLIDLEALRFFKDE